MSDAFLTPSLAEVFSKVLAAGSVILVKADGLREKEDFQFTCVISEIGPAKKFIRKDADTLDGAVLAAFDVYMTEVGMS
jgi:hypothetical protein